MTDSEIVIKCNYGRDKTPDWMDEPGRGGSNSSRACETEVTHRLINHHGINFHYNTFGLESLGGGTLTFGT